jgi:hypothetical protein
MFTFSAFVARWADLKGKINAFEHREIGRIARERATPVAFRAEPLCFRDLIERLEVACGA